ncbi:MAG: Asp-tRNA(Asn)/Glu-tRNA(Gln) amidotransferase subunit GatB [Candidatus Spechtbacterales bacterium]
MSYIPTIGLEIHAELNTQTKMFCASLNDPKEKRPNINVCPICMGHPGTLPVPNKEAIKKVIQVGLALNCKIAEFSKFDRKNYFYPDLPKGYQISQYDKPFCEGGHLNISEDKKVKITRIHLEEDAGRLVHPPGADYSLVDFNRAGIPLMELVTEPDMHSGEEAQRFAEELQLILRYLGASDANMEKGQMRVELNISLASEGSKILGTKVEVKNLNSFNVVGRATAYEIKRQSEILDNGEKVAQETRGWDEASQKTFSQRAKEEAHDYRYFPEPDIPPIVIGGNSEFEARNSKLPELPQQKRKRFVEEYKIDPKLAEIFVRDRELADYYEKVISEFLAWEEAIGHRDEEEEIRQELITLAANYITTDLRKLMAENKINIVGCKTTAEDFAEFINLIHTGKLSSRGAKDLLPEMLRTGGDPHQLMLDKGVGQVSEAGELEAVVDKVIKDNPGPVLDYKSGKENILQFLVGQVMKETKGVANPQVAAEILKRKLL